MKINEIEALTGITKKNIRFYEEQGLLSPRRNSENGYRDYGEQELLILRRIRLLRKLGVPIEEIRQMFAGTHTVGDGMRRHLVTLERERRNLEQSMGLCRELQNQEIPIDDLDVEDILARMEQLERSGTSFRDTRKSDVKRRYAAPVAVTAMVVLLMMGLIGLILWATLADPGNAPPIWFIGIIICVFAAIAVGAVLALGLRIREIGKGELDDAKNY